MEVLKLGSLFCVIMVVLAFKKPLNIAIICGLICAVIFFRIPIDAAIEVIGKSIISDDTILIVLSLYSITLLQRMLHHRLRIRYAQESMNKIFNNRRINACLAPTILGLLPSAGIITLAGEIVNDSCEDYLSPEDKTFVTSFFRHVPESFLPTYTSIILVITLGGVSIGSFVIAMVPMVAVLLSLGYYFFLRKIPTDTGVEPSKNKKKEALILGKNLWSIIATVSITLIFGLSIPVTLAIVVTANFFIDKFTIKDFSKMVVSAIEPKIILNMVVIMMFKDIVEYTGVISLLPDFFSQFNIPLYLVFALIFFFGAIISGATGIIALCMPMALATIPDGGLALVILLNCFAYAAMQVSPTHICLVLAASYFNTSLESLIKRSLPIVLVFCAIAFGYYHVLVWII